MNVDEARALLERSENEIEVRYRQDSDEYADIAAQLNLERDAAPLSWAEGLAKVAEMELIAFHRHDDEVKEVGDDLTVLYKPLNAARQVANDGCLRKQWERYEVGVYNHVRARKKFNTNQWPQRSTLRATSQQIGVYTFALTDSANETRTYYVAREAEMAEWCRYIEARGGEFLPHEIVLLAVRDHHKARGLSDAKAEQAAMERSEHRIELHEALWKLRCEERGYNWQHFRLVQECNRKEGAPDRGESASYCFQFMADLIECAPAAYLSPNIVFVRGHVVRTLRYWAKTDPESERAKQVYGMAMFFGPMGQNMIAGAVAQTINARKR